MYIDNTTLLAESTKADITLNIKKTKIMMNPIITSWYIDGEELEVVNDSMLLGSKIFVSQKALVLSRNQNVLVFWKEVLLCEQNV